MARTRRHSTQAQTMLLRQGDILLAGVDALPDGLWEPAAVSQDGRTVVAYGESTGHAHAVVGEEGAVTLLERPATATDGADTVEAVERYLQIGRSGATLVHEEHAAIKVPEGLYRVIRQREYTPEALRLVAD